VEEAERERQEEVAEKGYDSDEIAIIPLAS
jgi:hypothetical protein